MSLPKFFEAATDGSTLIVSSLGSLGSLAGEEIAYELTDLLEQFDKPELTRVVIDLQKASYFGTSMLQVMTALWKRVRAKGGRLALCNVSETGLEILHVTRFDTLWPICGSREEALQEVAN